MHLNLDIHNFYEHLVVEHLEENNLEEQFDPELIADICCLALTQLPARYIRHDIDMAFYLGRAEREKMRLEVDNAIDLAIAYLKTKTQENATR